MDFLKFYAILENRKLFFPRLTILNDPFEGHPPRSIIDSYRNKLAELEGKDFDKMLEIAKHNITVFKQGRFLICVSCWHNNPSESAAMWELYLKQNEGIAIKTTFEGLKDAFAKSEIEVTGGLVEYVNYDTFQRKEMNILCWATLKRLGFEHEREFRVAVLDPSSLNTAGISVPVDIESLIEEIYVSPSMPDWTVSLIQKLLIKYGFNREIKRSTISCHPMYYEIDEKRIKGEQAAQPDSQ